MQMLLGGKWADAANGATMEVVNPANGQVFDTVRCQERQWRMRNLLLLLQSKVKKNG